MVSVSNSASIIYLFTIQQVQYPWWFSSLLKKRPEKLKRRKAELADRDLISFKSHCEAEVLRLSESKQHKGDHLNVSRDTLHQFKPRSAGKQNYSRTTLFKNTKQLAKQWQHFSGGNKIDTLKTIIMFLTWKGPFKTLQSYNYEGKRHTVIVRITWLEMQNNARPSWKGQSDSKCVVCVWSVSSSKNYTHLVTRKPSSRDSQRWFLRICIKKGFIPSELPGAFGGLD